jgi:hypothetical protein
MAVESFLAREPDRGAERQTLAPILVDEPEARRLLGGLCAKTMYNLRRAGELPAVKIGTRTMYDVADLRQFIDRQKGAGHE